MTWHGRGWPYELWWIGWIWTEQLYESHSFHNKYKSRVMNCFCSPKQRFPFWLDLFHDGFLLPRSIKQSYLRRQPNEAEPDGRAWIEKPWSFTLFWGGSPRMSKGLDNFRCFGFPDFYRFLNLRKSREDVKLPFPKFLAHLELENIMEM